MPHRIIQPTKEQVRAYMAERSAARRPPPPPEVIRGQLGWHLDRPGNDDALLKFYLIPTNCSFLLARTAVQWLTAWPVFPLSPSESRLSFAESQQFSGVKISPLDQLITFQGMMLSLQALQHF